MIDWNTMVEKKEDPNWKEFVFAAGMGIFFAAAIVWSILAPMFMGGLK